MEQKMKLGILGTGKIVQEFLPWLAGPESPFAVQALCSTERSAPAAWAAAALPRARRV